MIVRDYVDAVIGLQYGDEGKGKITASLVAAKDYDYTVRYNGGPNAGHSIHKQNGAHYALHQIPSSIAYQKPGYIAPGCVLDIEKLMEETSDFILVEGFDPLDYLYIHPQVPLINSSHIKIDAAYHHGKQGSTRSGIAPAYAEYYNRSAKTFTSLENHLHNYSSLEKCLYDVDNLLLEGAQGFYLNPESGNYPYTTSSNSSPASAAASMCFPASKIRHVIGVAKCYETRSGEDPTFYNLFKENQFTNIKLSFTYQDFEDFERIQKAGNEYGVTTGRKRKVRFLDIDRLVNAIQSTGTTVLVLNKWDILDSLNLNKLILNGSVTSFIDSTHMYEFIKNTVKLCCSTVQHFVYSDSPSDVIDWSFL